MNAISHFTLDDATRDARVAVSRVDAPRGTARAARRMRRRQVLLRSGVLAAAVAIPTLAMGGPWRDWAGPFGIAPAQAAIAPMPFETAGLSFPGSALYYIEEQPRIAFDVAELRKAEGTIDSAPYVADFGAGAAARAFRMAGSGIDKARALQCLSMAIYYEAASESVAGQRAVAQVVLNRVAHPAYPSSVCGVVFQGSERRTGCQFSFTCDGALGRTPSRSGWARAQGVALGALAGEVYDPIGTATHYHTHAVNPYWASSLDLIGSIGAHRFYRWKGNAGKAAAFTNAYFGGEPLAAPHARSAAETTSGKASSAQFVPPPNSAIGLGRQADPRVGAPVAAAPVAPPVQDKLPGAGSVKKEYENSGRWLRQPGS